MFERLPTGRGGWLSWRKKKPGCSITTTSAPSTSCSASSTRAKVAAKALESLGISLDAVRQQVEEIIGQGQQAPSGHIPFTPGPRRSSS